jgi:hypothetical protein
MEHRLRQGRSTHFKNVTDGEGPDRDESHRLRDFAVGILRHLALEPKADEC